MKKLLYILPFLFMGSLQAQVESLDSIFGGRVDAIQTTLSISNATDTIQAGNTYSPSVDSITYTYVDTWLWGTEGTGTFNSSTVLIPIYTPSLDDETTGSVDLILNGTGECDNVADTINLVIESLFAEASQTMILPDSSYSIQFAVPASGIVQGTTYTETTGTSSEINILVTEQ